MNVSNDVIPLSVRVLDEESGVAQVVSLHDGRVQGREVQRCYGNVVVPDRVHCTGFKGHHWQY